MKLKSYNIINPRRTVNLALRQRHLHRKPRHYNTGKELDTETGLYYYGARYLDPKASRWLSGDPAVGEYIPVAPVNEEARKRNGNLPGMGGVFNYVNLHVYHYAGNNPVRYIDPDGRERRPLITGLSGVLPLAGSVDTGNQYLDSFIAGAGSIWNTCASVVNAPIRYVGDLINTIDYLITVLDDSLSDEYSLTGFGIREDLYVLSLFACMNLGSIVSTVQGGRDLLSNLYISARARNEATLLSKEASALYELSFSGNASAAQGIIIRMSETENGKIALRNLNTVFRYATQTASDNVEMSIFKGLARVTGFWME